MKSGFGKGCSGGGRLTGFLKEYFDFSDKSVPEPGYRFDQFIQVPDFVDPARPRAKTHYRKGDWEVTRVERYQAIDSAEYDEIVVCYCKFEPVANPALHPMPQAKVTADSFGGDERAYQEWKRSPENAGV